MFAKPNMKRVHWVTGASLLAGSLLTVSVSADPTTPTPKSAAEAPQTSAPGPLPKRLDLRVGDIRKYMTPEEFRALSAPPEESRTVLVQANAPQAPMKSQLDVPGGILAPFWALANPTQAWRIFLPDPRVNIKNIPPPEIKVPPPVFRWGP